MIEYTKLQSLIKNITKPGKGRQFKSDIMHPRRDWAIGLGVSTALLCIIGLVSYYLYMTASVTFTPTAEQVDTVVPYRAAVINSALTEYKMRAEQYRDLLPVAGGMDEEVVSANETVTSTTSVDSVDEVDDAIDSNNSVSEDELNNSNSETVNAPVLSN